MKPEDTTWAETQRAIHKPQNRTAMNSEMPKTDDAMIRIKVQDTFPMMVNADFARRLELRCKRLEEALRPFATLEFDKTYQGQTNPQAKIFGVNETSITGSDILAARAALADQQEEKP